MRSMRACINGATTRPYTLEEDLAAASKAGFPLVEIWSGKLGPYIEQHGVHGLAADLKARGLGVAAICPYSIRLFGDWRSGLAPIERASEIAAEVGSPLLLVCPDAPSDTEAGPDVWERAGERARAYAEIVAGYGLRLAIEPLGLHRFIPGAKQGLQLLQAANHPALGLMMDTFHYYKSGVTWEEIRAVPAAMWTILHINDVPEGDPRSLNDPDRLYPGEGILPLADTLRYFQSIGFQGGVSVEVFRKEYYELPIDEINRRAYAGVTGVLRAIGEA